MSTELAPAVRRALARVVQGKARRGLFAGKHIKFGNNVSEDGGNKCVFASRSSDLTAPTRGLAAPPRRRSSTNDSCRIFARAELAVDGFRTRKRSECTANSWRR